jgi:ribonuclease HI
LGFSIVNENQTLGKSINEMCSVYTAEAKAIFDACLILKNFSHRRVAIATNSLSNLMGVINPGNWNRLISWIRHFIYSSSNIQLVWIPVHTGLLGNENAGAEAKKVATQDRVDDATPEFRDFRRIVSEYEFTARKNRWANVEDNKMKEHKILLSKDRTYLTGNRAEDVFISRIRIGHTRLTHGHEAISRASATLVVVFFLTFSIIFHSLVVKKDCFPFAELMN